MALEKRTIEGREFWFALEHPSTEDPNTGEFIPTDQYYCVFSTREPGPLNRGEVLRDDRGRARFFRTAGQALAAGIREVEARLHLPPKAYAVGLPLGSTPEEFHAYTQLLRQQGITGDNGSRVEDSFGRRWLYVWSTRREAEQFASRLRQVTGNIDWEVYELSPPPGPADGPDGRSGPVDILIGRNSEGYGFGLHPNGLKLIHRRFPQAHPRPHVHLGRSRQTDDPVGSVPVYDHVAALLTGLSPGQMDELGGYRVVDPLTNLVLHEATPAGE